MLPLKDIAGVLGTYFVPLLRARVLTLFFAHIGGFVFGAATILLLTKHRPAMPTSRYPVY